MSKLEQTDYISRFIDFLENYSEEGFHKYRALAEALGTLGVTRLQIDVEDLKRYDEELARAYAENRLDVNTITGWFIKARTVISDGLEGVELKEKNGKEVVILSADFVNEIIRQMSEPVTIEELAKMLGWKYLKQNDKEYLEVDFTDFVKFLVTKK